MNVFPNYAMDGMSNNGQDPPASPSFADFLPLTNRGSYSQNNGLQRPSQQHPQQQQQQSGNWLQHQPHQQLFNTSNHRAWNPMSPFPNNTNGMHSMSPMMAMQGYNPVNYLPQDVLQDALVMSVPVRQSDEPLLVSTLVEASKCQKSYKMALDSLHGRNNHTSMLWKDYYLDNKYRIDHRVSSLLNQPKNMAPPPDRISQPTRVQNIKRDTPESSKKGSATPPPSIKRRKLTTVSPPPSASGRKTINSMTAPPSPEFNWNLLPPNASIKIPDPPSRSPTPPATVIPRGRGNKFTPEDKSFFLKFLTWRLKHNSSLSRQELCVMLAEQAPHHSHQSWAAFWSNNHDLPDKILAAAHGLEEEEVEDDSESEEEESEPERISPRRRPRYKDPSSDEDDAEMETDGDGDDEPSDDEDFEMPSFDQCKMGKKGHFTDTDFAIVARHIASIPNFRTESFHTKWTSFAEQYSQRTGKSWAEYYRRNERGLHKLAEKIKKSGILNHGTPKGKRKFVADD
ncbi:hypothetical protein C8J56DRAFT_918556 [Mycena floridula]|nr:hypothetical protein C8J56DRAFT_918556 [Mycena floridula]